MPVILTTILLFLTCTVSQSQDCKECELLGPLYKAMLCKIRCVREDCGVTKYYCDEANKNRTENQKCIYNGTFYNLGDTIGRMYNVAEHSMCDITCDNPDDKALIVSSFCGATCSAFDNAEYLDAVKLQMGYLLDNNYAFAIDLTVPKYQQVSGSPSIPGDCEGDPNNCCRYTNQSYKIGTSFDVPEIRCICSCPPLMCCDFL